MSSRSAGDQSVGRVDRATALPELGLVATGPQSRFPRRLEEAKVVQQLGRRLPVLRTDASLGLGDVDTARPQRVAIGQEVEQQAGRRLVAAKVGDQLPFKRREA